MSAKTGQVGVEKGQGWDVRILIEGAIVALDKNKSSVSDKKDRVKRSLLTDSRIWIQQLGSKGGNLDIHSTQHRHRTSGQHCDNLGRVFRGREVDMLPCSELFDS